VTEEGETEIMRKYIQDLENEKVIYEMKIENYGHIIRSILKDQVSEVELSTDNFEHMLEEAVKRKVIERKTKRFEEMGSSIRKGEGMIKEEIKL
jgi:hypothetical protein